MVPEATVGYPRSAARVSGVDVKKVESAHDASIVGGTLSRAFFDDPVLSWVFPDAERRWRIMPAMFELYAEAFSAHHETYMTTAGTGAALWLPPGAQLLSAAGEAVFVEQLAERAGPDADRLFELITLLDENHPEGTYYVLQLLGVEPRWQGCGIGSALMSPVLTQCDLERIPAYLEATSETSVPLYERQGFSVIGELELPDGPPLFRMWRAPS